MSFNFPNSPTVNQVYFAPGGGTYVWDGEKWMMTGTSGVVTAEPYNRIVNGAMMVSQETAYDTVVSTVNTYLADQWFISFATSGAPSFANRPTTLPDAPRCVRFNSGSTADTSVGATDIAYIAHPIEGYQIADFGWGTAAARQAVLRFTLTSSVAGLVVSVALRNNAANRSYVKNVTVTAANVPQEFVLVIPGDTTGTWPTDSTRGLLLQFVAMCGSTYIAPVEGAWQAGNYLGAAGIGNIMSAANQTYEVTRVGLYADPQATGKAPPWQTPDYASELAACQRYWNTFTCIVPVTGSAITYTYPRMRVAPSITGGGAGFAVNYAETGASGASQTTRGNQALIFNARM
jgi:hypothetical protein